MRKPLRRSRAFRARRDLLAAALAALATLSAGTPDSPAIATRAVLSERGSGRASAYPAGNRIVRRGEDLFVVWLDQRCQVSVTRLQADSGQPLQTAATSPAPGGAAMVLDAQGHLVLAFSLPDGRLHMVRAAKPGDIGDWQAVGTIRDRGTHPSLVCTADGALHLVYCGGDAPRRVLYRRRPADGDWTAPVALVASNAPEGYTHYGASLVPGPDGSLWLGFHVYDQHPPGGKAVGVLRSRDGGQTWGTAAAVPVLLPVTPDSAAVFLSGDGLDMRAGNLAISPQGTPHLVVTRLHQRPVGASLWHHDGTRWQARDLLSDITSAFPGRAVGMHGSATFDAAGRLYLALVTADSPGGGWGEPSWEVVLLVSADGGASFTARPVSNPNPAVPSWFPSLERPWGPTPLAGPPALVYTEGGPGTGAFEGETALVHVVLLR